MTLTIEEMCKLRQEKALEHLREVAARSEYGKGNKPMKTAKAELHRIIETVKAKWLVCVSGRVVATEYTREDALAYCVRHGLELSTVDLTPDELDALLTNDKTLLGIVKDCR